MYGTRLMQVPQFGIFAQGTIAHEFIEFDLRPDVDMQRATTRREMPIAGRRSSSGSLRISARPTSRSAACGPRTFRGSWPLGHMGSP